MYTSVPVLTNQLCQDWFSKNKKYFNKIEVLKVQLILI
jgi:hypothetical protein